MMDSLRVGDVVIITELNRLGRSVKELLAIIERIHKVGASIKSLRETWLDTTTPQGNLLLTIFAGLSQFERDLIRQRTKQGLNAARARGRKGGRPKTYTAKIKTAVNMYNSKLHTIAEITRATGISRATLYRSLKIQS
jgi:DNA invertase Pin-like site-specific DNA recombinase